MAFYGTLGVPSDASGDEIRRAYKRRALQLHPDKNLARETSETFAKVNEAYEVLSQPRRREIYDAFGKDGLRLYEGAYEIARASRATGTVLPPIMLVTALAAATTAIAVLLAAFVHLAALRLDGHLDALPWPLLFLPLWLADPLLLVVAALITAEAPGQLWPAVLRLLPPSALHLSFQVLLCARQGLQPPSRLPWLAVFAPFLVGRGSAIASIASDLACPRGREASSAPRAALLRRLLAALLAALQLSLLPPKLDEQLGWRWAAVLAPAWLLLLTEAVLAAAPCCRASRLEAPPRDPQVAPLLAHSRRAARLAAALLGIASLGWLGSALEALDEEKEADAEATTALERASPAVFILLLYAASVCCVCCCVRQARRQHMRDAPARGFQVPGVGSQRDEHDPLVPRSARSVRSAAPPSAPAAVSPAASPPPPMSAEPEVEDGATEPAAAVEIADVELR
jgi:hypothetical protein